METLPSPSLPVVRDHRRWRLARRVALFGLLAAFIALAVAPGLTVDLLWSGLVPLLPVVFLVHPGIWRNVCPLATLGMGPDTGPRPEAAAAASATGAYLALLLLVPLRPLGLDESALASAGLLALATGGALLGRRSARKSGFCNRWCPVLPVERLYGQRPLVEVPNPRCPSCTVCTPRGCMDLSSRAASAQLLGPGRRRFGWLGSPLGAFAAAFPGVVFAFFLLPPEPGVIQAYGRILLGGAASWAGASALVRITGASWRSAFPTLGAAAAAVYLWFALPAAAVTWGAPGLGGAARWAGLALVGAWWIHALVRREHRALRFDASP